MTNIDRRTANLLALLAPIMTASIGSPAHAAQPVTPVAKGDAGQAGWDPKVHWIGDEQIAMLMYPGMTILDLIGPQSMFASMMGARIHLVAKSLDPVTSDAGVTITPNATFDTCPRDVTVLFAPGGTDGTIKAATDEATLAFMADRGRRAKYVTSVCSGSLILGKAGLLNGFKATSHWSVRHVLAGFGAVPTDARVVRDRNRITGAGVTAGLDFGLAMVAEMRDQTYAECCQLMDEYDPDLPFHAGSLKTAPAEVRDAMTRLIAGFVRQAEGLVG